LTDKGERHGIKGWGRYTATETLKWYSVKGCRWCNNWRKIFEEEEDTFAKWECSCEVCEPVAK